MKIDPQTLKSLYSKMPEEVKDIFSGVETGEKLARIGKDHGLNVEQVSKMTELVGLVLLGINRAQDLVQNIASELNLSTPTAGKIASEINNNLFVRIRDVLQQVHEKNKEVRDGLGVKDSPVAPEPATQAQQPVPQTTPTSASQSMPTPATAAPQQSPATPPPTQGSGQAKEDLLKEIEDKKDELPAIFQGMTTPTPFEAKTGDGIFRSPAQTTDYSAPQTPKPEAPTPQASSGQAGGQATPTASQLGGQAKYPQGIDPYRELPE